MKPLDPRLLRWARSTRGYLIVTVVLGVLQTLAIVAQAYLLTDIVVSAFEDGAGLSDLRSALILLAAVVVIRAGAAWAGQVAGHFSAARAKSELRTALITHAVELGPVRLSAQTRGELSTLATRGIDALDDYFAKYLPQLVLAVLVPVVVGAVILSHDLLSAVTVALTIPLIPVFMILIGRATAGRMQRQWRSLAVLSGHFLDVVVGLPTLKVFGRARGQRRGIAETSERYRVGTMGVLRLSFLSGFVLELIATLSIAVIAVGIGVRLVGGQLDLRTGLLVLVLAPEVYLPLRLVGTYFHASAEGVSAAERIFEILETPVAAVESQPLPEAIEAIEFGPLTVMHAERSTAAVTVDSPITLRRGQVTAVIGESGCGKSTLISALMGFIAPSGGQIALSGTGHRVDLAKVDLAQWRSKVAYVGQSPWLFAGSLRDNVTLGSWDVDDSAVLQALRDAGCDLDDPDVRVTLPEGLETRIGESGSGVSVGQRRRIALARAFLRTSDWVILDEPTAALDGATEDVVVHAVQALRDRGAGVIVVAHRSALISIADQVLSLSTDVAPASVSTGGGADHSPARQSHATDEIAARDEIAVPDGIATTHGIAPTDKIAARDGIAVSDAAPEEISASDVVPLGPAGQSAMRRVAATLRPQRLRLAGAAVLGAAALGSTVGLMATSGWLISRASQQPPILALEVATVGVRFFGLTRGVARYAERLVSHDAAFRALGDIRVAVYERLERLAPQGLVDWRRGDLLARLGADVDATIDLPLRVLLPAASTAIVSVLTVAFVAVLSPLLAVVVAVALVIAAVALPLTASRVAANAVRSEAPLRGELTAAVVDTLAGSADLLALGVAPEAVARTDELDNRLTDAGKRASWAVGAASGLAALIGGLALVGVLAAGVQQVNVGALAGVWLATIALTTIAVQEGVQGLPAAALAHSRVTASADRITEVIDSPDPIADPTTPIPLDCNGNNATIELRGVAAGWGGASPVLTNIDLRVAPGTRTAVIGASGSGKSTLAAVLLRFCEFTAGSYTINETDVRQTASDDVRAVVGLCSQDAHIFDTTVRENLRLARPSATEPELLAALDDVALGDWLRALPQGLDTPVGEHGGRLSGGQRQRLALARSLLAEHDVLVLDEPTEHLDLATADGLIDDLVRLTRGRTTVLLTHRMRGVEAMDQVVVLEAGQIVERGTPSDLLADADSRLSRLMLRERRIDSLEVRDERR